MYLWVMNSLHGHMPNQQRILPFILIISCLAMRFTACNGLKECPDIPVLCSIQAEPDMDTLQFRKDLEELRLRGYRTFQLDIPIIKSLQGMPQADSGLIKILPGLSEMCNRYFPDWTLALVRLHPDSIADTLHLKPQNYDQWCSHYLHSAESYLSQITHPPERLIAGYDLPLTDTLPCLNLWMQALQSRFREVTWLIPVQRIPHPIHIVCTETGVLWRLISDDNSKPLVRKTLRKLADNSPGKPVYIGAFFPRQTDAYFDFVNILRFWPDTGKLRGIVFTSLFPRPVFLDTVSPGNLGEEQKLQMKIQAYLKKS